MVSLFEIPHTSESVRAFIEREHEFRFCAVEPLTLEGRPTGLKAVRVCTGTWRSLLPS